MLSETDSDLFHMSVHYSVKLVRLGDHTGSYQNAPLRDLASTGYGITTSFSGRHVVVRMVLCLSMRQMDRRHEGITF